MASYATLPADLFIPEVCFEYARQAFTTSLEMLQNLMGPSLDNPIQLVTPGDAAEGGQYVQQPVFKRIASLITKRDLTSFAAVDGLKLEGVNDQGVLISKKVGPVFYTPDAEYISKASPGQISAEFGKQAGENAVSQLQTSIINAIIGALSAMTQTAHTSTSWATDARTNLSPTVLTNALYLMGDFSGKIKHWVMRSESERDLFTDAQGRSYAGVGNLALAGNRNTNDLGLGHSVIDNAILTVADSGFDKYITVGLGPVAVRVFITRPLFFYPEVQYVNTEVVSRHMRGDMDYIIQIPGFAYVNGTGGANPTDAVLSTTSSWTPNYSSHKEVLMVNAVHNYSGN